MLSLISDGSIFLRASPMQCPRCDNSQLQLLIQQGGVELDCCGECDGLWFDGGELQEMLDGAIGALEIPEDAERSPLKCPRCGEKLFVFHYPRSNVEVDMCGQCKGIWLDGGELTQIALSHSAPDKSTPTYSFGHGQSLTYLVEKVQRRSEGHPMRVYFIDNVHILTDRDGYVELEVEQIPFERPGTEQRSMPVDKKGRFYDREGEGGSVGSAGKDDTPARISHLSDAYFFPWLPGRELREGESWIERFEAVSTPVVVDPFEMQASFTVDRVHERRGHRCAEVLFTYKGQRERDQGKDEIRGRGSWIFDLEERVDVFLEKQTAVNLKGETTTHFVRRVLCENPLGIVPPKASSD
jgi:Zn-finger nucleic acid-binding protein